MKFLKDTTPFTRIFFTVITILLGGIVVSLLGFLTCWIFLGISFDALSVRLANFSEPGNLNLLKFFQILQTIGMFIIPPLIVVRAFKEHPISYLRLDVKPTGFMLFMVCLVILAGGPVIDWFSLLNQHLVLPSWMAPLETWMRNSEDQANEITQAFLSTKSVGGLFSNLFIVAVLPAIGEELLFRGLLQKLVKNLTGNIHWAIWITAALFSALHLQFFGFLPRLLLGALFGYLLEWTGSLWLPMIAHFINNASGVLIFFFTGEGLEPDKADESLFYNSAFLMAMVSGVLLFFLLRYVHSKREMGSSADEPVTGTEN